MLLTAIPLLAKYDFHFSNTLVGIIAANSVFFSFMMLIGIITPTVMGCIADLVGVRSTFIILAPPVAVILLLMCRYVTYVDEPCE